MGSQYQHLGNLYMLRGICSIDGHVGNIVACQGLDALIELGGALGIAVETDVAEVGLHEAGLEIGDADGGVGHIDAQTVGEGLDGGLRSAVDIATGVGGIARHTTYIRDCRKILRKFITN